MENISIQEAALVVAFVGLFAVLAVVIIRLLTENRERALALKDAIPPFVLDTLVDAIERGVEAGATYASGTANKIDDAAMEAIRAEIRKIYDILEIDEEEAVG